MTPLAIQAINTLSNKPVLLGPISLVRIRLV